MQVSNRPAQHLRYSRQHRVVLHSAGKQCLKTRNSAVPTIFKGPAGRQTICGGVSEQTDTASRQSQARRRPAGAAAPQTTLLIELGGTLVDFELDGHRVAYNKAFKSLGYECIAWPPHVYNDLSRGNDTGEDMLRAFFQTMGWPMMLAASDRPAWVHKVFASKTAALIKMLQNNEVPLRAGVKQVVNDALEAGAQVGLLHTPAPNSFCPDVARLGGLLAESALSQLGPFPGPHAVKVVGVPPAAPSTTPDPAPTPGASMTGAQLAAAVEAGLEVRVPSSRCIMLASHPEITQAATGAGMVVVRVPCRKSEVGACKGVQAGFTGFEGTGACTWAALQDLVGAT